MSKFTNDIILHWLEEVKDPEIPVISIVDLGVITEVRIKDEAVKIELTPTFAGCPALDIMKDEIAAVLYKHGIQNLEIEVTYRISWSSDLISEKGKQALKLFGLAPPSSTVITDLDILPHATCPRCNGDDTELKNLFGSTLCRSIHYCNTCREAFEQFKPL